MVKFWPVRFQSPCVAIRSKAVVLFLLIHCFLWLPLFVGGRCLIIVLLERIWRPFQFCNHRAEEDRVGYFNVSVTSHIKCIVAL